MASSFAMPGFTRPTKIEWIFPSATTDWIANIASESTQKIALNLAEIITKSQLQTSVSLITQEKFAEWFEYYQQKMLEQGHDVIATAAWLESKISAGLQIYLIEFRRNDQLVGGSIFSKNQTEKYTEHFKASDRITISNLKNASLGTVMDLFFIKTAIAAQATSISSGSSRNGFGYYNNLGYLAFKIKLGYKPKVSEFSEFDENFEYNLAQPCIWFITSDQRTLKVLQLNSEKITSEVTGLVAQLGLEVQDKSE